MAVVCCEKGHYYDDVKYSECPHCKDGIDKIRKETYIDDIEKLKTQAFAAREFDDKKTVALYMEPREKDDASKTIGAYNFEAGTALLTGWIVCVNGPLRGRDYKLFHGWNRIGRSLSMNICIADDEKISDYNHAAIVFDDRSIKFYIINEEGTSTYLNGNYIVGSEEIKSGDRIQIGDSELIFIAF